MNSADLVEELAGISCLRGQSREHLEQIAAVAEVREYAESAVVFREGETADHLFLVISGRLSLELSPSTIYQKCLVDVGPGEMLGWSSLVEHSHFAATAIVVEPARLVSIDGVWLRKTCKDDPQFGYEFTQRAMLALAKRLTSTWSQLAQLYISSYVPLTAGRDE